MKLFGYNISLAKKPVKTATNATRGRASKTIKKQSKREVSFEIKDIKTALQMVQNVDTPDRKKLLQIYDYILKDGHLFSQIKTALIKVQSEPWMFYKDGKPVEDISKSMRQKWFNNIIAYIFEKELFGFTLIEADDIDAANFKIGTLTKFDREYVSIEKQWVLIEGNMNGAYMPYGEYKNELDLMEFGDKETLGTLLQCAYNVIWKFYARSDWSRANEKVGTPIITVVADTNNDDELDAMETKAANFGTDGYMVGQKGDEFGLLERKSDNFHITFKDKIALCNNEISLTINGQTGTTEAVPFVGTGQVMERTMDDFTAARLQGIVDEMKENVIPYLIHKGFKLEGYEFDYPRLVRERERKINGIPTATDPTTKPNETAPAPAPPKKKK